MAVADQPRLRPATVAVHLPIELREGVLLLLLAAVVEGEQSLLQILARVQQVVLFILLPVLSSKAVPQGRRILGLGLQTHHWDRAQGLTCA